MSHRMAILAATIAVAAAAAHAGTPAKGTSPLSRVYADSSGALHVVTAAGVDRRVGGTLRYDSARLGPDGRTFGATPLDSLDQDPPHHDMVEVRQKLVIWRDGKRLRSFPGDEFIRAWGFWKGGTVAIYSGGLHFAGHYDLYDLATGKSVAGGEDPVTDQSPDWIRSLEP